MCVCVCGGGGVGLYLAYRTCLVGKGSLAVLRQLQPETAGREETLVSSEEAYDPGPGRERQEMRNICQLLYPLNNTDTQTQIHRQQQQKKSSKIYQKTQRFVKKNKNHEQ